MKKAVFQGTALSTSQRRQLDFQRRTKSAFLNSALEQQVQDTLKAVQERKDKGIAPEKIWSRVSDESGTISVAEWVDR
ncbi:hypothetical protein [uncultured Caballeronia sp.]|uniref:hypothetical protein n=1 Tax=uncultured Caballeronia sp. TaxID=1827198 RepID=UPI0035CBFA49